MSYSDDTAEFLFTGQPTMEALADNGIQQPRCDSCWWMRPTVQIIFGDGAVFWLCESCRPFNPADVTVTDITIDYDKETT